MGHPPDLDSNRFYKVERLKKRKSVTRLFTEGHQSRFYPVVMYYLRYDPDTDLPFNKVLFSVPKKHFKRAVVRNKVRRRMAEAYRHNKKFLYNNNEGLPFLLGYVYLSKTVHSFPEIEAAIKASLDYLIKNQNSK